MVQQLNHQKLIAFRESDTSMDKKRNCNFSKVGVQTGSPTKTSKIFIRSCLPHFCIAFISRTAIRLTQVAEVKKTKAAKCYALCKENLHSHCKGWYEFLHSYLSSQNDVYCRPALVTGLAPGNLKILYRSIVFLTYLTFELYYEKENPI